ncbi:hypothetical protein D3C81_324160 [compost metagenome]
MSQVTKFYSNDITIGSNLYEFIFKFRWNDMSGGTDSEAHLHISPQHAKAFLEAFRLQLQSYEASFGEIKYIAPQEITRLIEQGKLARPGEVTDIKEGYNE